MTPATNSSHPETRPTTSRTRKTSRRGQLVAVALGAACVMIACGSPAEVSQTNTAAPVASPQKPTAANPSTQPTVTVSAQRPVAPPQPAPGQLITPPPVVMNTDLKTLDGKTLRLAGYKGKVVVVDLWATWCGPCRVEIPHLITLGNEFKKRGVEIVGLTIEDPAKDAAKVKKFADEFKINYKIGWSPNEVSRGLMGNQTNIPQTFILTRDGRVFKRFIGFNPQATPPQIRDAIEQALAATG